LIRMLQLSIYVGTEEMALAVESENSRARARGGQVCYGCINSCGLP